MTRTAIICGGSIGGLFAAAALRAHGWQVDVFERSSVELAGRGAGIVTHDILIDALNNVGAGSEALGVDVHERVAFDLQGGEVASLPYFQTVTSWDRIHQLLRRILPDEHHHLGCAVTGYSQSEDGVEVRFENGETAQADILVGCDGFRSVVRSWMLPQITPQYSGYVVWRALADEADFSTGLLKLIFDKFGFFLPTGTQIVGYPIAGAGNDLRPGHRRYNFVWYAPVSAQQLADMLTDESGRHHALSIPPPLIREAVLQRMEREAGEILPQAFVEVLAQSERPFFTPIYDHHSPRMAEGRVALAGDAACVARPHVGMGVTKAASDALCLARQLEQGSVEDALEAYSAERVPAAKAAFERSRKLGRFIFEDPATGTNRDGRSNPNLEEIMRKTAIADFG
uniref:FAD binding domain-containing protein n=1 Tax=Pararhizobium sp. IMCC3301 TaxID=3067904 RepID=UPI0027410252|nr:FAD-dependent monooxygenase [Pararhizobium sp. IMCC3301]